MTDIFDRDPDAFVEPWTPRVGDRVRIRLSGECELPLPSWCIGIDLGLTTLHDPVQDRVTGIVRPWASLESYDYWAGLGHTYAVEYDYSLLIAGKAYPDGLFAAYELELLP